MKILGTCSNWMCINFFACTKSSVTAAVAAGTAVGTFENWKQIVCLLCDNCVINVLDV